MTAALQATGVASMFVAAIPVVLIVLLLLRWAAAMPRPFRGAWLLLAPLAVLALIQVAAEFGAGEFLTALIFVLAGGADR
jgi:hypothetical protein